MKNSLKISLIALTLVLATACSNKENDTGIESDEIKASTEIPTEAKKDGQKWVLMKDFSAAAEAYYKKNGEYAKEISEYEPFITNLPENYEADLKGGFRYTVKADSQGKENECYEFSTSFLASDYVTHNDENGEFKVGNLGQGLCQ